MKTLWTLFLSVFTLMCAQGQSKWCDRLIQHGDTTVCQNITRKGKVFQEHFYINHKREFTRWWHYRKNGEYEFTQRKKKGVFAKKHGPAVRFYPDGKVKLYMFFQNGTRVGKCYSYYPSGKMKSACNTNHRGKADGLLTEFHENGQVAYQARWQDGLLMEILVQKDQNGQDIPIGNFRNGTGTWNYREPGTDQTWEMHYQDGKYKKSTKVKNQ